MRVIIIGGGIGGLTAALSLHAAGLQDIEVFEAAPEIKALGVGINVLPHACRELVELGLEERLAETAIACQRLLYSNAHGQEIWSEPRGKAAGYHWPQYSIHRGELQMILLDAVLERLGQESVHFGDALASVETGDRGATAIFRSGKRESAEVIVAADGIHSAARAQFYPNEGAPKWNRRILWRGMTESDPFLGGATMVMSGHQAQKFVCYPISRETAARGRSLTNWIAELEYPEEFAWRREDWNRAGRLEDFLPQFESWAFGWLDVPGLIRNADRVFEYPMVDRDPVDRWTFGRTTLLGDAAHPMHPVGSNGASQAVLDARTLAFELATHADVDEALAAYEAKRRPATGRIVLSNRGNGPEQVMQWAHERAPGGFKAVEDVLSREELEGVAANYKNIAGFSVSDLNNRPSLTIRERQPLGTAGEA
ncbi:MAG TPA: flavin-dependent oxidoreductase [Caulobacterales bacterium]|nr:flavin-dependent oxidoreductase [Caulobacterales bacterium]